MQYASCPGGPPSGWVFRNAEQCRSPASASPQSSSKLLRRGITQRRVDSGGPWQLLRLAPSPTASAVSRGNRVIPRGRTKHHSTLRTEACNDPVWELFNASRSCYSIDSWQDWGFIPGRKTTKKAFKINTRKHPPKIHLCSNSAIT